MKYLGKYSKVITLRCEVLILTSTYPIPSFAIYYANAAYHVPERSCGSILIWRYTKGVLDKTELSQYLLFPIYG